MQDNMTIKTNRIIKKIKSIIDGNIIKESPIAAYLDENKQITFFNWEFYKQSIIKNFHGVEVFDYNFEFKLTKTYRLWRKEKAFFNILKEEKVNFAFYKLIPDELPNLITPEYVLRNGTETFNKLNRNFYNKTKKFVQEKFSNKVRVLLMSDILKNSKLSNIYGLSYNRVLFSFDNSFRSVYVSDQDFQEDVNFRRSHYSNILKISARLGKEYSVKMFALFAAETSVLFALEKRGTLPNLVLLNSEPNLSIKKYETLRKLEKRRILPKICL